MGPRTAPLLLRPLSILCILPLLAVCETLEAMTQLAGYGRLGKDPVRRTTKSGELMVTASLALDVDRLTDDRQPAPWWLNLVAFGAQAESLERHERGEMISVTGPLERSYWTDQNGEVRESWGIVVDSLVSARTVRPGHRKTRKKAHAPKEKQEGLWGS